MIMFVLGIIWTFWSIWAGVVCYAVVSGKIADNPATNLSCIILVTVVTPICLAVWLWNWFFKGETGLFGDPLWAFLNLERIHVKGKYYYG